MILTRARYSGWSNLLQNSSHRRAHSSTFRILTVAPQHERMLDKLFNKS